VLVHQRRGVLVLERLVRHHVTPVTGRVTDGEKNRLLFCPRARECLFSPWLPVHRIVCVLKEVRARLLSETVHVRHRSYLRNLRQPSTLAVTRAAIPKAMRTAKIGLSLKMLPPR